jgi:hypothetical protein
MPSSASQGIPTTDVGIKCKWTEGSSLRRLLRNPQVTGFSQKLEMGAV